MLVRYIDDSTGNDIFSLDTTDLSGIILLLKENNSVIFNSGVNYYYSYLALNNHFDNGTWKQEVLLHLIP
jgi:hypothetical protein